MHSGRRSTKDSGIPVCSSVLNRFPNSELHAEVDETVRGCDVYLVQPTGPPVDSHLMELLFLRFSCEAGLWSLVSRFGINSSHPAS